MRWLIPVMLLVATLTVMLFWSSGDRLFLLSGGSILWVTSIAIIRTIDPKVAPETIRRVAIQHLVSAAALGCGNAMVSMGVMSGQGVHNAIFDSAWQIGFISAGMLVYINLPLAYLLFALPITVPFFWPFLVSPDRTIVIVPFLLIYLCVLTRAGVDQNRMFVAAWHNSLRLSEAEADARTAAEDRMRRAEQASVTTRDEEGARRRQMVALAQRFERDIVAVADTLSSTVEELDRSAREMADVTRCSASAAEDVAVRTGDTVTSVATLAAAANELAHAIAAIAAQIETHATLSDRATRSAEDSEARVAVMSEEAEDVAGIVTLIENITNQTKLLALNATIEAARAGETGRGFSVVAQEVKTLAHRTGDATREVTTKVDSILSRIDPAVASIRSTAEEIDGVAVIANAIATSIAQQRHASEDIDRETETVARHVDDIRNRMAMLAERANHAGRLTGGVSCAAEQVSEQADTLQRAATDFLRALRAA